MSHNQRVDARNRETGILRTARPDTGRPRSVRTIQFEDAVLQYIEDNPTTSTRAIAKDLNTSNANVWNVLHQMGMQPFKIQKYKTYQPMTFLARGILPMVSPPNCKNS